jgi:hypothetical protein
MNLAVNVQDVEIELLTINADELPSKFGSSMVISAPITTSDALNNCMQTFDGMESRLYRTRECTKH